MTTRATPRDERETRARLLNAAARLFAEHGVARVTVRDICRKARANVAAVNYHFGGKDGLYRAVIQMAITTMQSTTEAARAAGDGKAPDERLRAYVSVFLERIAGHNHKPWIHQLMLRELSDPTPALDMVAEQVLKPRMMYLCEVIGQLTGRPPGDAAVIRCALSVQSQFNNMLWSRAVARLVTSSATMPGTIDEIADHISRFSLGGIAKTRGEA